MYILYNFFQIFMIIVFTSHLVFIFGLLDTLHCKNWKRKQQEFDYFLSFL
jgi:hypothetical protein